MMAKLKQRQEEGSSHGRSLAKCREANLTMINDDLVEVTVQNMDGEPDGTVGTLSERAYRAIEELVVTLQLPPGCKVSEKTLSARLGIGDRHSRPVQTDRSPARVGKDHCRTGGAACHSR